MWMSVLKRNFSNGRFPVARLFPSTNWNVRAGWTAVFPAGRSSFFAAREAGRRIRPSSWKEAPRARHISLGAGFSPGNRRDFRFGAYASCCPVLHRNRLLSPGFLPDSCILSEPCPFRPPFSIGTGGFFMPFLRGNSPKRLAALDRKQEMFSNVGRGRECRPLHVAPLPAFVMVSVICCYYGLLFEKSESIASTRKSGSS